MSLAFAKPLAVVKVGGSLFDLPLLGSRLSTYLDSLDAFSPLLIPGGGATADVVRAWDKTHRLGEEASHWLALQSLALNARFLVRLLANAQVVEGLSAAQHCSLRNRIPVLDPFRFVRGDENRPGYLPHNWTVTSDSIAARVALVAGASRLVLLKSTPIPEAPDWRLAAQNGKIDSYFATVVEGAAFQIEVVDFRTQR